jgi:hypothetical protein
MPTIKKYISKQKKQIHKQKMKTKKRNIKSKSNRMRGGSKYGASPEVGRAKPNVTSNVGRAKPVDLPKKLTVSNLTSLYHAKNKAKVTVATRRLVISNRTQAEYAVRAPARNKLPEDIKTYKKARTEYYKALSTVPKEVRDVVLAKAKDIKDAHRDRQTKWGPYTPYL